MAKKQQQTETLPAYVRIMNKMKATGTVTLFEDAVSARPRIWVPSRNLGINWAIGHGIPFGCMCELYGSESSGKSSLALSLAAEFQRHHNAIVIFYDVEQALDDSMVSRTGLDLGRTVLADEEICSSVGNVLNHMIETVELIADDREEYGEEGAPLIIVVWDSVAFTATESLSDARKTKRADGEGKAVTVGVVEERVGGIARLLTNGLKHVVPMFVRNNVLGIFINQLRDNMKSGGFGEQTRTAGGRALKHAANFRLSVKKESKSKVYNGGSPTIKRGDQVVGAVATVEVTKNKLAAPLKKIHMVSMFSTGIDVEQTSILHALIDLKSENVLPQPLKGRIAMYDRNMYIPELAQYYRDNPSAWEEFAEKVKVAQKEVDSNITPDMYNKLQAESEALLASEEVISEEAGDENND